MFSQFSEGDEYHPSDKIYTHPQLHHSIYLGDIQAALDIQFINRQGITTIVTAATGLDHVKYDAPLKHIVYPLLDAKHENIAKFFNDFYNVVQEQLVKGNMLVHCAAGISRSSTLVIAYIMKKHQWSFKEAVAFVRKNRPTVLPNLGFQRQLKEYQNQLKEQNSKKLERRMVSKTSQEKKHSSVPEKQNVLPQISPLGRTQLRPKILDLFSQQSQKKSSRSSKRSSQPNPRGDYEFYGTRRMTFKPLKSKSISDRSPLMVNSTPVEVNQARLKHSMPVSKIEEVMVRRLQLNEKKGQLNEKKVQTERQLRHKPLHRLAFY